MLGWQYGPVGAKFVAPPLGRGRVCPSYLDSLALCLVVIAGTSPAMTPSGLSLDTPIAANSLFRHTNSLFR